MHGCKEPASRYKVREHAVSNVPGRRRHDYIYFTGATAHSSGVTQSKVSSVQWLELTSLLYKAAFSNPGTSSLMVRNTVPSPAQGSNMTGCEHSLSSFRQLIKTERGRTSSGLVANVTGLLRARSQYVRSLVACFWGTGYP